MVVETRDIGNREHIAILYHSGTFLRLKCSKNHLKIALVALGGALVAQKSII